MFFDTHAHYDSSKFQDDRHAVLRAVFESGVSLIVDPGDTVERSANALSLAHQYEFIYAAAGVHPEEFDTWQSDSIDRLRALAMDPKVVAIGEIGLDYYWDKEHVELQKQMFRAQIELALELNLPIIVHDREAHGDCFDIVMQYPELRGVFHCYSGSAEMAKELLKKGWYLGFDGPITYKNNVKAAEVLAVTPVDRILLETDSPYLSPVPNRGKRNDSRNLPYIAEAVARVKRLTIQEIAALTAENGKRLFGIE